QAWNVSFTVAEIQGIPTSGGFPPFSRPEKHTHLRSVLVTRVCVSSNTYRYHEVGSCAAQSHFSVTRGFRGRGGAITAVDRSASLGAFHSRQADGDHKAPTCSGPCGDHTFVGLHHGADDGQPQARAAPGIEPVTRTASKGFEESLDLVGGDDLARILHLHGRHTLVQAAAYGDLPCLDVVLHGVLHEVAHEPFQQHRIPQHVGRSQVLAQSQIAPLQLAVDLAEHRADDLPQIHPGPYLQFAVALGQEQQTVDESFVSGVG